jgi:hypothetical protein
MRGSSKLVNQFPAKSGCYIIRDGDTVLYVGQSNNMRRRWMEHHRRDVIEKAYPNAIVETILWNGDLLQKEAELIMALNPVMNTKTSRTVAEASGVTYKPSNRVKELAQAKGLGFLKFAGKCMLVGLSYDSAKDLWEGKFKKRGWNGSTKMIVAGILHRPIAEVFPDD